MTTRHVVLRHVGKVTDKMINTGRFPVKLENGKMPLVKEEKLFVKAPEVRKVRIMGWKGKTRKSQKKGATWARE